MVMDVPIGYLIGLVEVDTTIAAAIALYGWFGAYYDEPAVLSAPLGYAGPDLPPMFVAHGDNDSLVPVELAREFVAGHPQPRRSAEPRPGAWLALIAATPHYPAGNVRT